MIHVVKCINYQDGELLEFADYQGVLPEENCSRSLVPLLKALGDVKSWDAVYELYDLQEDPYETRDIYPSARINKSILDMKQDLDQWFAKQYNDY